jgi:NAD(P)-dependent dehydrogenase (short-subunit alcohol dehydrogenase family)
VTVSVVTGAGAGIGRAVAQALAARGDSVVCADVDGGAARAVANELGRAEAVQLDVRDAEACEAMAALAVSAFDGLDVLVTCAGIERHAPAEELGEAVYDEVLDVNLKGSFLAARAAGRRMIERGSGGRIVLIGSVNSTMAHPRNLAYSASKGAVMMLARGLAVDWAEHGITINCVAPGVVDTAMSAKSLADPVRREQLLNRVPMRRPAAPAEIASVVAFLASDAAGYMNGAYVPVDGGWLAAA